MELKKLNQLRKAIAKEDNEDNVASITHDLLEHCITHTLPFNNYLTTTVLLQERNATPVINDNLLLISQIIEDLTHVCSIGDTDDEYKLIAWFVQIDGEAPSMLPKGTSDFMSSTLRKQGLLSQEDHLYLFPYYYSEQDLNCDPLVHSHWLHQGMLNIHAGLYQGGESHVATPCHDGEHLFIVGVIKSQHCRLLLEDLDELSEQGITVGWHILEDRRRTLENVSNAITDYLQSQHKYGIIEGIGPPSFCFEAYRETQLFHNISYVVSQLDVVATQDQFTSVKFDIKAHWHNGEVNLIASLQGQEKSLTFELEWRLPWFLQEDIEDHLAQFHHYTASLTTPDYHEMNNRLVH